MQSSRNVRAVYVVLAALASVWLALRNWRHPLLRLTGAYANHVALWLLLLLPWAAAIVALTQLRRSVRLLMMALVGCAIFYTADDLFFVSLDLLSTPVGTPDPGFKPLRRLPLPRGGSLVVYLDNCGAPCPFVVVVRQERAVLPGVLLVRDIYARRDIEDASVEILPPDRAVVDGEEVRVRLWVYW